MTAGAVRETTRPLLMGRPVDAGVECRRVVSLTCLAGRSRATPQSPLGVAPLFNKKHPRRWVGRVHDNGPREVALCSESY